MPSSACTEARLLSMDTRRVCSFCCTTRVMALIASSATPTALTSFISPAAATPEPFATISNSSMSFRSSWPLRLTLSRYFYRTREGCLNAPSSRVPKPVCAVSGVLSSWLTLEGRRGLVLVRLDEFVINLVYHLNESEHFWLPSPLTRLRHPVKASGKVLEFVSRLPPPPGLNNPRPRPSPAPL